MTLVWFVPALAVAGHASLPVRAVPSLQAFREGSTSMQQAIALLGQPSSMGTDHAQGAQRQIVRWRGVTPASREHGTASTLGRTAERSAVSSSIRHGLSRLFGSMSSHSTAQDIANAAARSTADQAGAQAQNSADQAIADRGKGSQPWTCTLYFTQGGLYQSGRCAVDR
ncbi:hypothetical protein LF63_0102000 [Oleiagrimonas soli]|nr:hypothetical protein LF63_0102000 [Oleiagrimonas soli]